MRPVENSVHDIVWLNVKEMSYVSTQYQPPGSPQGRDTLLEAPTSEDEPPRAAAQYNPLFLVGAQLAIPLLYETSMI